MKKIFTLAIILTAAFTAQAQQPKLDTLGNKVILTTPEGKFEVYRETGKSYIQKKDKRNNFHNVYIIRREDISTAPVQAPRTELAFNK